MTSKSSRRWLREHFSDAYVKKAQHEGYRSRAVYKLLELQERDKLFKPGMTVIDLGAAPGSWSELIIKLVGSKGHVIAFDLLPIQPIPGVELMQGDFTEEAEMEGLLQRLRASKIDWVVSDMAPNMSGIESADQTRSIYLAELVLDFALKALSQNGGMLLKVFQGSGSDIFLKQVREHFEKVYIRKPKASRGRSREIYVLARGLTEPSNIRYDD